MNYKVINTGSDGNAVLINGEILIDCGVSFKKLEPYYKNIKLVLLSHVHGDHFNKTTIKKLSQLRPTLRFGCCEWLKQELLDIGVHIQNIDVYTLDKQVNYPYFCVLTPIKLFHDVQQCGYKILMNNKKLIYATDTNKIDHIEAKNYDVYLIEANYLNEEELKGRAENNEYFNRVLNTHLSMEQANEWLLKQMGDNSIYEYMHQHKEKKIANRFIEIEPLLKKVSDITKTPYQLNDEDIYTAMDELLSCYNDLKDNYYQLKYNQTESEPYEFGE